jgi:pimeloyl-ACP methyl ester carboxylesterase
MPLPLLLGALAGLASLAIVIGGAWIVHAWSTGTLLAGAWLALGVAMLAWSVLGRQIVLAFFPRGFDEPQPGIADSITSEDLPAPDGSILHIEREGARHKPVLILTHGWTLDSQAWYYARRTLAPHFRLVTWDLPGLGKSTPPQDGQYSVERLAEDLRAVIVSTGALRVTLVGHSIGGMMMLTLCRLHPQLVDKRVNGMVFVDTTYTFPLKTGSAPKLMQALQKPLIEPLLHWTVWTWPLAWLQNWLNYFNGSSHLINRYTGFGPEVTRGQLDLAAWYTAKDHPGVVAKGLLAVLQWNEEATLERIQSPVKIIAGENDRLTRPSASREMQERIPTASMQTIRRAGHNGLLEDDESAYALAIAQAARGFAAPPDRG